MNIPVSELQLLKGMISTVGGELSQIDKMVDPTKPVNNMPANRINTRKIIQMDGEQPVVTNTAKVTPNVLADITKLQNEIAGGVGVSAPTPPQSPQGSIAPPPDSKQMEFSFMNAQSGDKSISKMLSLLDDIYRQQVKTNKLLEKINENTQKKPRKQRTTKPKQKTSDGVAGRTAEIEIPKQQSGHIGKEVDNDDPQIDLCGVGSSELSKSEIIDKKNIEDESPQPVDKKKLKHS